MREPEHEIQEDGGLIGNIVALACVGIAALYSELFYSGPIPPTHLPEEPAEPN